MYVLSALILPPFCRFLHRYEMDPAALFRLRFAGVQVLDAGHAEMASGLS